MRFFYLIGLILLIGCEDQSTAVVAATGQMPVIISTDLATGLINGSRAGPSDVDDGFAVAMAIANPRLDVRAIVVTFGNNLLGAELPLAQKLVNDVIAKPITVIAGAHLKMPDPEVVWFDGTTHPEVCLNDGVKYMAQQITERDETVILALGPLTDTACLVQNFPDLVSRIGGVVAIMGRDPGEAFELNGHTGLTDFNYVSDPHAAKIVLDSGLPVTFMGFSVTSSALILASEIMSLETQRNPVGQFLARASRPWLDFWQKTFGEPGIHPWDQNAIYYATNPEAYNCYPATAEIIDCTKEVCPGHGPNQPPSLDKETSQLWLRPATGGRMTFCSEFVDASAKDAFVAQALLF